VKNLFVAAFLLCLLLLFPALAFAQAASEPVILTTPPTPTAAPLTSDFSYPQTIKIGAVGAPEGTPATPGIEWLVIFGLLACVGSILLVRRIAKSGQTRQ
jgi:hypothetical protein